MPGSPFDCCCSTVATGFCDQRLTFLFSSLYSNPFPTDSWYSCICDECTGGPQLFDRQKLDDGAHQHRRITWVRMYIRRGKHSTSIHALEPFAWEVAWTERLLVPTSVSVRVAKLSEERLPRTFDDYYPRRASCASRRNENMASGIE